ncbi:MAG: YndJ family protein [Candidatus Brocadiae bacterium]|nr:YndJ family protein [Candidatus Brocadiia bacterium]
MSSPCTPCRRWLRFSALAGFAAWMAISVLVHARIADMGLGWSVQLNVTGIFLLAPLVLVPLGLALVPGPADDIGGPFWFWAARLQPPAAAAIVASFWLRPGPLAAALATPWLLMAALVALDGFARLWRRRLARPEEICVDAAMVFLPAGAAWALASRLGLTPIGFQEPLVLLTAVHFHFAGFVAALLAGLTGRARRSWGRPGGALYLPLAAGVVLGVPLLAVGIATHRTLELAGALILAFSVGALALYTALWVAPRFRPLAAAFLLAFSCACAICGMHFAGRYAASHWRGNDAISIRRMALVHGLLNALGFSLCGVAAWTRVDRK